MAFIFKELSVEDQTKVADIQQRIAVLENEKAKVQTALSQSQANYNQQMNLIAVEIDKLKGEFVAIREVITQ